MGGLTRHQEYIVAGLAKLSKWENRGVAELNELYNFYVKNTSGERVMPVARRQFEKLLDKLELRGIIKKKMEYIKLFPLN